MQDAVLALGLGTDDKVQCLVEESHRAEIEEGGCYLGCFRFLRSFKKSIVQLALRLLKAIVCVSV